MPELTDEFVKKSSRFSTVDELKADIKDYIEHQRESLKKSSAENSVFKAVIDSSSVEIPQRMVDREVQSLREDYRQRLAQQGIDWNRFIESQGGSEEKFNETLVEDAKIRIKNSLVIDKISKDENISVEQADFSDRLSRIASAYGIGPQDFVKQFGQNADFLQNISQQIVNDKVRSFLVENNKIEYVEVQPEKEAVEA